MQAGFPFKKQITNRGHSIDWGGDGRYMYVLRYTATNRTVLVFDMNLLAASNYAGAGTWTVNPIIATINVTGTTGADLCYIARSKQIIVTGSSNCVRIDADPASATFNTNLGAYSQSIAFGSNCIYDPISNAVLSPSTGFKKLVDAANDITGGGFITTNDTGWNTFGSQILFDSYGCAILGSTQFRGNSIYDPFEILNNNKWVQVAQWNQSTNSGGCGFCDRYWYVVDNAAIRIYTKEIYPKFVAVISTIGFNARMHFNKDFNYIMSMRTNAAENNISVINTRTLTVAATLSKGTILNGETDNQRIISHKNIMVTSQNLPHFHVFDLATLSYVGYYNFGTLNTRICNNILTT
jgi:hypothetical protein